MINKNYERLPHEIFALVEKAKNQSERVKILLQYESYTLKTILQAAFNKNIIFDLPDGAPPYTPDGGAPGQQLQSLKKQINILGKFVVGYTAISKIKKETHFIKLLENVFPKDAEILIAMKDKKLSGLYPTLTRAVVEKAFPQIL
jgi:hypothetical protein